MNPKKVGPRSALARRAALDHSDTSSIPSIASNSNPSASGVGRLDRPLPSDLDAERATLGSVLLDPTCLDAVRAIVTPDAFFADADHGRVFVAMLALADDGKPVDVVALLDHFGGDATARVTLDALLRTSMDVAVSAANATYYAGIVAKHHDRRRMILAGHALIDAAHDHDTDPANAAAHHAEALQQVGARAGSDVGPVLTCLADVMPESVSWLWPNRFALGKLNLIVGDPCLGKTWIMCDIAARVSAGSCWPDARDAVNEPTTVIILTAEDGLSDTIRPRIDALGGDPLRVHVLTAVKRRGSKHETMFSLEHDLPLLADAIIRTGAKVVFIDPLTAYLGGTDAHRDAQVRALLAPLADLAAKHGCAIIGIMHLGKGAGRQAIYRTNGSIAFTAAPRAVWAVAKHPEDETARVLVNVKLNIGQPAPAWGYRFIDNVLAWDAAPSTVDVELLLNPKPPGSSGGAAEEAETFLRDLLADGPLPARKVCELAKEAGISKSTLDRVKRRIAVRSTRIVNDDGDRWEWSLPPSGDSHGRSSTSPTLSHTERDNLDDLGDLPADPDDFEQQRDRVFRECNAQIRAALDDSKSGGAL